MPQYRTFAPVTKYKFDDEDWEPNQFQVKKLSSLTHCSLVIVRDSQDERRRIDQRLTNNRAQGQSSEMLWSTRPWSRSPSPVHPARQKAQIRSNDMQVVRATI